MDTERARDDLRRDLQEGRAALLWKLDGLTDYDVRRPMTATGTDLLGLVEHLTFVALGYFGVVLGRPAQQALRWVEDDGDPNWDMWAPASESREDVVAGYRRAWAHAAAAEA